MEATINIEDKILHGKNAQSIEKYLRREPQNLLRLKTSKVAQEVIQTVRLASKCLHGKC